MIAKTEVLVLPNATSFPTRVGGITERLARELMQSALPRSLEPTEDPVDITSLFKDIQPDVQIFVHVDASGLARVVMDRGVGLHERPTRVLDRTLGLNKIQVLCAHPRFGLAGRPPYVFGAVQTTPVLT